jgi:SAM-dependent methyltransferase
MSACVTPTSTANNFPYSIPPEPTVSQPVGSFLFSEAAMRFLADRAALSYRYVRRLLKSAPPSVACNVCGWQGTAFRSDACPKCRASIRHRLLLAAVQLDGGTLSAKIQGKHVLHFAPERAVEAVLRPMAGQYVTADLHKKRCDLRLDISNMYAIRAGAFDTVIACDVLECVLEDRQALREIHRVLRPAGCAILTVPQKDGAAAAHEDISIHYPQDRARLFGTADRVRIYGADFPQLVAAAGFAVSVIDHHDFTDEQVKKHVLFPTALSSHPLATNYRKLFVADSSVHSGFDPLSQMQ